MKLRFYFLPLLMAAAAVGSAPALRAEEGEMRPSRSEVRREAIALIDAQLAAFRSHDLKKAYRLAAVSLREQFSLTRFTETVRQGYPEIWNNSRAEYGIVQDNGVRALLNVRVFQLDGVSASYDYVLLKEPGGWRIAGVTPHGVPPATSSDSA